jgi:CheY-like chemotaxis protein
VEPAPSKRPLLLCVDDEETPLFFRKLVLEREGYDVLIAHSAAEALDMLLGTSVDMVLSDILMPRMPGTELARIIKQKYPALPVVLISGVNEIPPEAALAEMFISKLEGPVVMCQKIRAVLSGQKASPASTYSQNIATPELRSDISQGDI